jgi:uncharacterized protein
LEVVLALNLGKIRTAEDHFERVYEPGELAVASEDFRVIRPVSLKFDIYKDKQHFRLVGRVETTLELNCSRCLDAFTWPVDASFDLRYHPLTATSGDAEREIQDDDLTTAFYENDEIDLGQMMQEQFYLTLPMKPLCSADCRGLCPVCGINRNHGTCTCTTDVEDPRLAALKTLRKES